MSIEPLGGPVGAPADGAGDGGHACPCCPRSGRQRLLRIKQSEKRREPLMRLSHLRHALWEQYRWRELPPIRLTSLGKPYFPDFPEVHFNLSHTIGACWWPCPGAGGGGYRAHPAGERAGHAASGGCDHGTGLLPELGPAGGPGQAQRRRRGGPCWRQRPRSSLGSDSIFWTPFRAMWREWPPGTGPARPGAQILPG